MGALFSTHRIDSMVEDVYSEFDANKIVIVHIPKMGNEDHWTEVICNHIDSKYSGGYETRHQYEYDSDDRPKNLIDQVLPNFNDSAVRDEMLLDSSHSKPIFILLRMTGLSEEWDAFFSELVWCYQGWNKDTYSKKIVLLFLGIEEIPAWVSGPAIRYYQLWNVITWEEMRTLAQTWLMEEEGEHYYRAWQVASYVGASKLDPFFLKELCTHCPMNYHAIREEVESVPLTAQSTEKLELRSNVTGYTWKVPIEVEKIWLDGRVTSITSDRGIIQSWTSVAVDSRALILSQSIWQEQIASIFPLIARLSDISADAVTKSLGSDEWVDVALEKDYGYFKEPGVIIHVFCDEGNKLGRIPKHVWEFLHKLKDIRNTLAHRDYIDSGQMRSLWHARLNM